MYAFLVILGAVIAVAGALIAVPGLPLEGREFDASIITPGAVAVVGGLILIGLGLAVRVLTRIERALAVRPLAAPAAIAEAAAAPEAAATSPAPTPAVEPPKPAATRIPFPRKIEARPKPAPAAATSSLPEDAALERLREQFPTLARLEGAPVVEETDVSLLPKAPARVDEEVAETTDTVVQISDAAPVKAEPRIELPRPVGRPERPRNFDAFWPKKPRPPARNGQAVPAAVQPAVAIQPAVAVQPVPVAEEAVEPALPAEPTQFQFSEAAPEPQLAAAPEPSVLKSGVVDGMAYTLYSDGSIEAQLPQGMLRFGSIAELRQHIEQSA
jgi:hypothetical protein